MRRTVPILLLLPAVFFVLPPGVSSACTCAMTDPAGAVANADVAFKGTVTGRADPEGGGKFISSGRDVFYAFDVDEVVKGSPDDPAQIVTAASGASCGADFAVGRRYMVFASQRDDRLTTSLCAGSEELTAQPAAVQDAAAESDPASERPPSGPVDELLGDSSGGPSVLLILAALAAAGAVVAMAVGRARQPNRLDDPPI